MEPTKAEFRTLFIFIDESGNFDFSPNGTKNFVMAAVVTSVPTQTGTTLMNLKYQLLKSGENIQYFHATEDKQVIRNEVFAEIAKAGNLNAHVVYGNKRYVADSLKTETNLHALYARALISYCIQKYSKKETGNIVVVLDQALTTKQQKTFHANVKPRLKELGIPFSLIFQSIKFDYIGQLADYIAWSKFVELEREEKRPWESLQSGNSISDFDIFQNNWARKSDHPD
jgi:hypothetical protein